MNNVPSVIGFCLDEAVQLLSEKGCKIIITETRSPKVEISGECRVVRQKINGLNIDLTISYF